ncbi:MAG: single-stranded-DNA-specific exonuclease RecJ [Peptoniphilaceae bacterium]|nr:single-stranded-DNA-specific exonuclease RecJ [Peptoniphilaceae bacterium]MDY6019574.1 single-stranded-DNA-specific exonuclease RecJ [Anaerococcus sp.]
MTKWFLYRKKNNYINNLKIDGITKLQALILANRDIIDPKTVSMFIRPSLNDLHDPFLFNDMDKAIDLILNAIENGLKIRIFGDYDQDGIASTMTLLDGLLYFYDNVSFDIPDRVLEGYGISDLMVEDAINDKISLVITCDNGITCFDQVEKLKNNGIDVIVTDHHQVEKEDKDGWLKQKLPLADCVINPKRLDSKYPFSDLCGAGVAFKLVQALFISLGGDLDYLYGLLEYVAMGTVCDVVSLTDENRIFVIEGLKRINHTNKLGISALLRENSWNKEVDAYTLGFVIGPCMNATGRLSTAKLAINLLMEEDIDKINQDAKSLVALNNERKRLTEEGLKAVDKQIVNNKFYQDNVIVVYEDSLQESICGIVAGRIKEKYNRPTIILSNSIEEATLKGSGRSIEAYNIYEEVFKYSDKLESFGGHPMACGLSIKKERVDDFRKFLNENSKLTKDDFNKIINIDMSLPISKLSLEFAESLNKLEPFGKDNPKPVFADKKVKIKEALLIGKNKNTLKMALEKNGSIVNAIKFNAVDDYEYLSDKFKEKIIDNYIDIVYYPSINEFRGRRSLQVKLIDMR